MTNLNMTIISSGWRLCLEYPSSLFVCLFVCPSVCQSINSRTLGCMFLVLSILLAYAFRKEPIVFGAN